MSFNFNAVNFKDFYTEPCVFSKIKDIKLIELDFHCVAWVMPKGLNLGGQKFNSVSNSVRYAISSLSSGRNQTKFGV